MPKTTVHTLNFHYILLSFIFLKTKKNILGHDVLYVGVSGPVVACEEVNIKHMGYGQYSISYTVRDRGRHLIMIKWGEQHVPGSPFTVDVI